MTAILIVDDEKDIRELLKDIVQDAGYKAVDVSDGSSAIEAVKKQEFDAVILDVWLQDSYVDGLSVLEFMVKYNPDLPVIMISGHGTIETAVQSIKDGAYDYLEKPFDEDKLLTALKRAVELFKLKRENGELKRKLGSPKIIGNSAPINLLKSTIEKVAQTASRVLISGSSGCGKKLVAEMIHFKSKRSKEPFVVFHPVNFNLEKFQQELIGNNASGRIGVFNLAHKGTLYIDEVADMSMDMQNIFLRLIQQAGMDVRVIASTSKNIEQLVKDGHFREDLYYRLNVMPIKVPSLTERKEDIPELCKYFIEQLAVSSGLIIRELAEDAIAALQLYKWPGNIRQLKNILEWLLIMSPGEMKDSIRASMLPSSVLSKQATISRPDHNANLLSLPLREAREEFEKQYIAAQIERCNGNISRAAKKIQMDRSALTRKIKSLKIWNDRVLLAGNTEEFIEENNSEFDQVS
ncbi:sigma-54-dependent transcriptional regulator [Rickettsiales endosymbiont of Stachyamoeba lipophora]|uniref:sigma-54-dependent transcriptional regulator n=1 Tax=Rickettsiales endosymbiont of Stachyamoeba lipophora TaxID=2486578 RepID=UPI000F654337|nr:sigma-54 dependent transcriptional regulator [Rickettsiales endosymbiont of Stachyamoeba lipophora]AZL15350.1 sigma-54-dependent Fis family transcriptional regulator [Rickettsiales endosymbiont of Stachyamoeba lipophora]